MNKLTLTAAKEKDKCHVSGIAYTGAKMKAGWGLPVVVDLSGLTADATVPLLLNHDNSPESRLGVVSATIDGNGVTISGDIVSTSEDAKNVIEQAESGADWQLSIGADTEEFEEIQPDEVRAVNGQEHTGAFYLIKKATLREVSVVAVGADSHTTMRIAAKLSSQPKQGVKMTPTTDPAPVDSGAITAAREEAIKAERTRVNDIKLICAGEHADIEAAAINNGEAPDIVRQKVLDAIRAARPQKSGEIIIKGNTPKTSMPKVLEAAFCQSLGLGATEDNAINAQADEMFRHNLSLGGFLFAMARQNGYVGDTYRGFESEILKAAFSTNEANNVVSNIANKQLAKAFEADDMEILKICGERTVKDFKTNTAVRLIGDYGFKRVAPGGEIEHGSLTDSTLTHSAKTYGRMLSITREMIINDDIGAFMDILSALANGAHDALKEEVIAKLTDTTFFSTANGNYRSNSDTALSVAGLGVASTYLKKQYYQDAAKKKHYLNLGAKYLVVPAALEVTARTIYESTNIDNSTVGTNNIFARRYIPVCDAALDEKSTAAYWLFSDPARYAAIVISYLNGRKQPFIQQTQTSPGTLGIVCEGYFDFGVDFGEKFAAFKCSGTN